MQIFEEKTNNNSIEQIIIEATVTHLKRLAKKLISDDTQHNFLLGILDDTSQRKEYLQLAGVTKTAKLASSLISTFISQETIHSYADYLGLLNAYFTFENISDNLAMHMTSKIDKAGLKDKIKILKNFNSSMVTTIQCEKPDKSFLISCLDELKKISTFNLSLSPSSLRSCLEQYKKQHLVKEELEYNLESYLILNMESCLDTLQSIKEHFLYDFIAQGLKDRYSAMNELLENHSDLSIITAIDIGRKTILVSPTLAYAIAALDCASPIPQLSEATDILKDTCETAAILVRLLNDIGTPLLTLNEEKLKTLQKDLENKIKGTRHFDCLADFLRDIAKQDQYLDLLCRIMKDIQHEEFNICLDRYRMLPTEYLSHFFEALQFCSTHYKEKYTQLMQLLGTLTEKLTDSRPSTIILRFVKFHEKMYSANFETKKGDYAVAASQQSLPSSCNGFFKEPDTLKIITAQIFGILKDKYELKVEQHHNEIRICLLPCAVDLHFESDEPYHQLKNILEKNIDDLGKLQISGCLSIQVTSEQKGKMLESIFKNINSFSTQKILASKSF